MQRSLKVSFVASAGVFLAALLAALFHQNTINGHTLTPLEQLPMAVVAATLFAALALLGTWLGLRRNQAAPVNYLAGVAISVVYIFLTFVGNEFIRSPPRTVTVPSREAGFMGLSALVIALVWGIGAPYLIALLAKRLSWTFPPRRLGK